MEKLNISNKALLGILAIILVLLIIINFLLENMRQTGLDYENIEASKLINQGEKVTDREIYYTLEDIIVKYISSYNTVVDEQGNTYYLEAQAENSYEEYYEALIESYQVYLNEEEYIEVARNFLNKFFVIGGDPEFEVHYYMQTQGILKGVYELQQNEYICKLYNKTNHKYGYIGIVLDPKEEQYRIFIIE